VLPENMLSLVKSRVRLHNSENVQKMALTAARKVAERAHAAWEAAPLPGTTPAPFIAKRLEAFASALLGSGKTEDADLLPPTHVLRKACNDPWSELVGAESRLSALAKSTLEGVTRASLRKRDDAALAELNKKLTHLFVTNFAKNEAAVSVTGIERAAVVAAAALTHEECERRGYACSEPEHPLYVAALAKRGALEATEEAGAVYQTATGVDLELGALGALHVRGASETPTLQVAEVAKCWSPNGTFAHPAIREPVSAAYEQATPGAERALIGKLALSVGARTADFTEFFVSGAMSGVLAVGKRALTLRKSLLPYVLSEEAVEAGWMPPDGESALPSSLEFDVPPEVRFWKPAAGEDPKLIRDQLVKSGLFTADTVQLVGGVVRRTFTKTFVDDPLPAAPAVFAAAAPEEGPYARVIAAVEKSDLPGAAVGMRGGDQLAGSGWAEYTATVKGFGVFFIEDGELAPAEIVKRVGTLPAPAYLVGCPDSAAARVELAKLGRPFLLSEATDRVFVCSHGVRDAAVTWVDTLKAFVPPTPAACPDCGGGPGMAVSCAKCMSGAGSTHKRMDVRLLKNEATTPPDERFVLGIVLEPETVDSQSEIYSADEVRKSAHTYMAHYQNAGLQHTALINDHVQIVESYLAPADFTIGEQPVKKGTWVMGMKVTSEELWTAIKTGALTGYSIGGTGVRTEEA
jgi:hypothetical protein